MSIRSVAVRLRGRRDRSAGADPLPGSVCRAPYTSMYLDQHGNVRACCQNAEHPMGNVAERSLRAIWEGDEANVLRDALLAHDLGHGCQFCRWQVDEGNDALVFARTFDHLRAESLRPRWPKQLELSLSNACNLQCAMCNGDWSSSIRANREGRAPLPRVYDDRFFEELRPFLEHVEVVKILGGEPFLGRESLRVMELLVELGSSAEVHVTTNGTQWSRRIERILERLPMVIVLSLDAADKATYEAIRIGADLDVVLANLDRFRSYAAEHGTSVNLAHCLMTSNWRHFPDFLRFAEARGLRAYVNTVTYPNSLSLFHLPPSRLREVVDAYEQVDARLADELTLNLALWQDQLGRLRHRLDGLTGGDAVDYYLGVLGFPLVSRDGGDAPGAARSLAAERADGQPTHLRLDLDHRVDRVVTGPPVVLGADLGALRGRDVEAILAAFGPVHGAPSVSAPAVEHADVRHWRLTFPSEATPAVSVFVAPVRDGEGVISGFDAHLAVEAAVAGGPSPAVDDLEAAFRAGRPSVHRIEIGPDGRVAGVDSAGGALGRVLEATVGVAADDLVATLTDALGAVADFATEPAAGDGAARYRVRFVRADGAETGIEALVLPLPTDHLGAAGSAVLIDQVG